MTAQTSTQAQVIPKFGEQKKAFSIDELKRLINAAKNMRDLNQAKVFYTQSEQGPSQKVEFNINKWFMIEYSTVCVATCDPQKSRIFKLGGQLYLNIFPGFLHILRPISTFESTTHLAVKFIFSHIQDIWCSGDWNLTEYIIKWLAGVAAGRKMYSILYLKSGQGWGKGIITDFIQRSVLGTQLVYKTSDPETIRGSFQWAITGVDNDDRRTVFLDVSPSRKGDLNYFKKLSDAMKYPVKNHITDLPVQEFYRVYTSYCETHCITPLSKINASRILSNELGINSRKIRVGKTTPRVYSISREDLYKKFLTKKWIHETDEINIEGIDVETPEKPASDPKALEKFLANIYSIPANNPQDVQEKPAEEKPAPVKKKPTEETKKTPPPVPLKASLRQDTDEPIDSFSDCYLSDEEPDQEDEPPAEEPALKAVDDYDVLDDLLSTQILQLRTQLLNNNPKQPIPEPDTELEVDWDPEPKEGTRAHWAWHERHRWDHVSDNYDWEILAFEVEECPTTRIEDEYQYYLREVVDRFKDWIEYNGYLPKTPSRKELADLIRAYKEDHDAEIIPTTSGYETMKMNKGKAREIPEERPKTDMEREWEAANGFVDELDIDEACDMIDSF
ncbi:uncharacterized protein OCT59_018626 [Rhizophagus irregularis]|uniref:uncharacterized protein n=1 Tax=Rhizophagus irregularis TaxID=588596 RepID=UPI00333493F7|nr:hypothetical protein OCT59_018626 [Rhizophagus irregularis]